MPKDPKRNIQNYQLQGGHLNEFEFQKNQTEIAGDSELPFPDETNQPNIAQATKRLAEVTAEAHGIVERKKRGLMKSGGRKSIATGKKSTKKIAAKSAKKTTTQSGTKKRASVSSRQKPAAHR